MTRNQPSQTESASTRCAERVKSAFSPTMPQDIPIAPTTTFQYFSGATQPPNSQFSTFSSNSILSASSSESSPSQYPALDLDLDLNLKQQVLGSSSTDTSAIDASFPIFSGNCHASTFDFTNYAELGFSQAMDYGHPSSHWDEPGVYHVAPSMAFSDPSEYQDDPSLAPAVASSRFDEDFVDVSMDYQGVESVEDTLAGVGSSTTATAFSTSPPTGPSADLYHANAWSSSIDTSPSDGWQLLPHEEPSLSPVSIPSGASFTTSPDLSNITIGSFNQNGILIHKPVAGHSHGIDRYIDQGAIAASSRLPRTPQISDLHVGSAPAALPALVYVHRSVDNSLERRLTLPQDDTIMTRPTGNIKGRKGGLNPTQRRNAANMRIIKACETCRKRRAKCDPGNPCGSCISYWRGELHLHPCRPHVPTAWSQLPDILLPILLRWCPSEESLVVHLTGQWDVSLQLLHLPFSFGFGPPMWLKTRFVQTKNSSDLLHTNTSYDWPAKEPIRGPKTMYHHLMLPVVLDEPKGVPAHIQNHLERLVRDHFRDYPLYESPLALLMPIHRLYVGLDYDPFLGKCLKLLILVHCCGDISLDESDPTVQQIIRGLFASSVNPGTHVIPCLVRGQIGTAISHLVQTFMREVLEELERRSCTKDCKDFSPILAAYIILAMVVETVQYHGAKMGFHSTEIARFDAKLPNILEACRDIDERGIAQLFLLYQRCFSQCHAGAFSLQNDVSSAHFSTSIGGSAQGPRRSRANSTKSNTSTGTGTGTPATAASRRVMNPRQAFISDIRAIISKAQTQEHIRHRATIEISETMPLDHFFDRILARLFPAMNE